MSEDKTTPAPNAPVAAAPAEGVKVATAPAPNPTQAVQQEPAKPNVPDLGVDDETPVIKPDRLKMLKDRATQMGISYSPNIGEDALAQKIKDKIEGTVSKEDNPVKEDAALTERQLKNQARKEMLAENMKLIRLRIVNLNPQKADLPGEIITVSNGIIGTVRKYVPFGEATEDGYHVPNIIYKMMKERKFLSLKKKKNSQTGKEYIEQMMAPEFGLEVLPPLTQEELDELAVRQAAGNGSN